MTEQQPGVATEATPLRIVVRSDYVPTFDDMVTLEELNAKDAEGRPLVSWRQRRDFFNRVIDGGAGALPAVDAATMSAIGQALKAHFERLANPNG